MNNKTLSKTRGIKLNNETLSKTSGIKLNNETLSKTSGIKFKDKLGYALGDTAGLMSFGIIGSFLQMFYTDVLYIEPYKIIILMLIARVWDAVNDPIWGSIIDRRKPSKNGKFRPYLKWCSAPLAISAILVFTKLPGLSESQYLIYAYITYIFYGMMYTAINIPYGSLASIITSDELERSDLSVFRSLGAGLGGLPGQIILPLFVYSTAVESGIKYLDGNKLTAAVAILAGFSVIIYLFSYKMTTERVVSLSSENKTSIIHTFKTLTKNRPFVVLCLASMLMIAAQQYTQTMYNYLFKDYFLKPELYTLVTIFTYLPIVLLLPFIKKIVIRFGKKEACAAGMAISALANIVLWLIRTQSPTVFLIFCFLSGLGMTFLVLEVWALVTDVIDYQDYLTKRREEGSSYAFFSFTRKLGQTIAGTFGTGVLSIIGYDAKNITEEVASRMYTFTTIIPAIMFLIMFILLAFLYPLNKQKLKKLHKTEYIK